MPSYYLDSSAVVKRYVNESGSAWIQALCQDQDNAIFISELALVEVGSAFARRCRRGEITEAERASYLDAFVQDSAQTYQLVAVTRGIVEHALDLTQLHALRAYDALQLASMLTANAVLTAVGASELIFVSADSKLLEHAAAEGARAENPNVL
jgi:predicted nucleic acid-binding protein